MPEGPSIVILKELVNDLNLEGKLVVSVTGDAEIDKQRMLHEKLQSFRSWGKHFLICFKDFTIRIHFMMFGTYRINNGKKSRPRLGIGFKDNELDFYTCQVKLIDGDINKIYDWSVDIMSDEWDDKKALKTLKELPEMLVCDVLLDQDIFSGVGNIIKNEVLYRIKVHPLTRIAELPLPKLKAMIKEARIYSFEFLKYKRENTLSRHWLAYSKKKCMRCNLPMHKKPLGRNKRISFFCSNCQVKY
ncbi:MAG: endonuclease [Pedobacter sp.]|nr:MAG: endonuclease [Pedobacter sp.]